MRGKGRPFASKLTPTQEHELALSIVALMGEEMISLSQACARKGREVGVSRATALAILRRNGFEQELMTPEFFRRRAEVAAGHRRQYTLADKQGIAQRLTAMAMREAAEIESEYERTGVMTDSMGKRLARVMNTLRQSIGIDETLLKVGITPPGYTRPDVEPAKTESATQVPDVTSGESLLMEARRRRDALMAQREA